MDSDMTTQIKPMPARHRATLVGDVFEAQLGAPPRLLPRAGRRRRFRLVRSGITAAIGAAVFVSATLVPRPLDADRGDTGTKPGIEVPHA
jgi:hypothetical protein